MLSSSLSLGCPEAEALLPLYADGEAAPEDQALLDEHLARCASCRGRLLELQALKSALRQRAREEAQVPAALLARVRGDIASAARGERRRRVLAVGAPLFAGFGALLFVSAALLSAAKERPRTPLEGSLLVDQALSLHTLDVPVDVASPDPTRVGAFLAARIGHPVHVPRLDPAGFGLAGARVINVDNRRAAQLFYEGGLGHRLSLVAVPDPEGRLADRVQKGAHAEARSGVAIASFTKGSEGPQGAHLRARRGELTVHVWSGEGAVYSLAGKLDDERLDRLLSAVNGRDEAWRSANVRRVAHELDPPLR